MTKAERKLLQANETPEQKLLRAIFGSNTDEQELRKRKRRARQNKE